MHAAAFQDRQCESAIWLHQIGLDNKPPEYKGSTVLFHYFFYFPRQLAKVADALIPSNISLCGTHMSFHPVHFGSVGIPVWQLVSCIRSHVYGVSRRTLLSCVRARTSSCTSVGLCCTLNHLSLHMSDNHRDSAFKMRGRFCGQWSMCKSVIPQVSHYSDQQVLSKGQCWRAVS